ncbi:MAG: YjbH domain-containing protein [Pseudomonadota bacterium]
MNHRERGLKPFKYFNYFVSALPCANCSAGCPTPSSPRFDGGWKRLRHAAIILLLPLLLLLSVGLAPAPAQDEPVQPPYRALAANPGYTGIWDMPNARIIPDWEMRMGGAASYPWYYFYGGLGLFDILEVNGRITGVHGIKALSNDYGDYKDKSVDLKLQLLRDRSFWPAIAVGATDVHGTGLFTSRYAAASKKIWRFDLTVGVGQGMLGGKSRDQRNDKRKSSSKEYNYAGHYLLGSDTDFKVFGGVELEVLDNLWLSGEYSSINYEKVKGGKKARTPINAGIKYRLWDVLSLQGSYERGQYLAGSASLQFPLDPEGVLGWKKEPLPIMEEKLAWAAFVADDQDLAEILAQALRRDGFSVVRVIVARPNLWVEIENSRYISPVMAMKRLYLVLENTAPNWIDQYFLVLTRNGIFQSGLRSKREHIKDYLDEKIDSKAFFNLAEVSLYREDMWGSFRQEAASEPKETYKRNRIWSLGLNPHVGTYFNDPSGFAKFSLNAQILGSLTPWKGGLFATTYNIPVYNKISSSTDLNEPKAVQTDFMDFASRKTSHLTSYGFDQIVELPLATRLRVGAGAFEAAYAGFSGELYTTIWEGRFGVGVEGTVAWKRDKKYDFALNEDYRYEPFHTYFLNLYAKPFPSLGVEMGLKIGRFLAGDPGVRIDLGRNFKYFTLGGWYTVTDTKVFKSEKNKNYNDKGVFISFPFSSFNETPVFGWLYYAISPWTRDPGQMTAQFRTLYPFGKQQETPSEIKENFEVLKW